ncbi:TIGR03435 family protein [Granulicella sp. dw_53]|uniref:TIGR03435 family protein n=1 Tax=Granulicella sp. dw_53 TaxID=2719792 RepID=UPI001BD62577|nr:TIGR03435 family protein [Granulicella sp. dw_53]
MQLCGKKSTGFAFKNGFVAAAMTLVMGFASTLQGQATPPRPEVEVAAIHRSAPGGGDLGNVHITPSRFEAHNMTVRKLMYIAYKVKADRIVGGPGWLNSETYDITAVVDDMAGDNFPLTLQTLLEDRFKLKIHRETKDAPVYDLTLAKGGLKMQPTKPGSCVPFDLSKNRPTQNPDQLRCNTWTGTRSGFRNAIGVTMTDAAGVGFQSLTGQLSLILDRPVIDQTGLQGLFDVHLEWTPDEIAATAPVDAGQPAPSAETAPSIFVAVREQLGLELKPGRGPVTVLVIDSVDRPSEN